MLQLNDSSFVFSILLQVVFYTEFCQLFSFSDEMYGDFEDLERDGEDGDEDNDSDDYYGSEDDDDDGEDKDSEDGGEKGLFQ